MQARKTTVDIYIRGKNVTMSLLPYLKQTTFNNSIGNEVDELVLDLADRDDLFIGPWLPERGDKLAVTVTCSDWFKDGDKIEFKCGNGDFEIDSVATKGPPNEVSIKAVSTLNSTIRRELRDKSWEKIYFKELSRQIAEKHNLTLVFRTEDSFFDRIDQKEQSDLAFLAQTANELDCILKIENNKLIIFDEEDLELQDVTVTIKRSDTKSWDLKTEAHDLYKEVKVHYFNPHEKKKNTATISHKRIKRGSSNKKKPTNHPKPKDKYSTWSYLDQANLKGGGKTLELRRRFRSLAEAQRYAIAKLRQKNKGETTGEIQLMGNPNLPAGVVIALDGFGWYDGAYLVEKSSHKILSSGYGTDITIRRVLIESDNDE